MTGQIRKTFGITVAVSACGAIISLTAIFIDSFCIEHVGLDTFLHALASLLSFAFVYLALEFGRGKDWARFPLKIALMLIGIGFGVLLSIVSAEEENQNWVEIFISIGVIIMITVPVIGSALMLGENTDPSEETTSEIPIEQCVSD